jgi:hypothetical protein
MKEQVLLMCMWKDVETRCCHLGDMSRDTRGVVALKFSTKFFHLDFCN